jgi:hypothetical protein
MTSFRFLSMLLACACALVGTAARADDAPPPPRSQARSSARHLTFNQVPLDAQGLRLIVMLERQSGQRVPDGAYWYDSATGAAGRWGGPTLAFLPPGLRLGGRLPAQASGGGTGVFINGRELHPMDVLGLQRLLRSPILPGRYWVDAQGNAGYEGGPAIINLVAAARRAGGGGGAWSSHYDAGTGSSRDNMNLASDGQTTCVSTSTYSHCTGE